jgi:hypothetical protein
LDIVKSLLTVFLAIVILLLNFETLAEEIAPEPSRYFVIQNLATEKTRVYERCTVTPDCPHRLVFKADNVVGRPEVGTPEDPEAFKTWVGHAQITGWMKFYQDYKKHYPHWYKAGQDLKTLPPPAPRDANDNPQKSLLWGKKWKFDRDGEPIIYGAFGWYAAMLSPAKEVNYQWMHGTMGWGMDGDVAIQLTRSYLLNLFSDPGSSGCTRLSNASIAYLRSLLPVGTDLYRVYARESARLPQCAKFTAFGNCAQLNVDPRYAKQTKRLAWDYILLTDGAQKMGGLAADVPTVLASHIPVIPGVNLIEKGSVTFDQYPTPVQRNYTWIASSGKTGDRYEIDEPYGEQATNFRGYFLVDEGRFIDYAHPQDPSRRNNIRVGGLEDFKSTVPEGLATHGKHTPPKVIYKERPPQS